MELFFKRGGAQDDPCGHLKIIKKISQHKWTDSWDHINNYSCYWQLHPDLILKHSYSNYYCLVVWVSHRAQCSTRKSNRKWAICILSLQEWASHLMMINYLEIFKSSSHILRTKLCRRAPPLWHWYHLLLRTVALFVFEIEHFFTPHNNKSSQLAFKWILFDVNRRLSLKPCQPRYEWICSNAHLLITDKDISVFIQNMGNWVWNSAFSEMEK